MKKLLRIGIPAFIILVAGAIFVFAGSPGERDTSEVTVQAKDSSSDHYSCELDKGY